jgi:hypothetical protein
MGDDYPGLRSASTPGYSYFAPLGLKSRKKVGPFGKLRDRVFGTASELVELPVKVRDRVINATTVRGSEWSPSTGSGTGVPSVRSVKGSTRMELRVREVDIEVGAKSKGSNGVVAVGLPHRNYSVFKQADPNKR